MEAKPVVDGEVRTGVAALTAVLIIDDFDTFDCELYIPNVDELQMGHGTIILPDHVQQRVIEVKLQKKRKEQDTKTDT
jgi:hypothetical protein